jgi:hypothetical protein
MFLSTMMMAELLSWHHRIKQVKLALAQKNWTGTYTPSMRLSYNSNFGEIQFYPEGGMKLSI